MKLTKKILILFIAFIYSILIGSTTFHSYYNINEDTFPPYIPIEVEDDSNKSVYLTFDDGPSKNTEKILDILKDNDVKATFFIIGPYIEAHNKLVKRAFDEGHSIGNHTFDHEYKDVYTSEDMFWNNFNKQQDFIKSVTGSPSTIFRFPGGSRNEIVSRAHGKDFNRNIIEKLKNSGVTCFDWNVDSGDGRGNNIPPETLLNNIKNDLQNKPIAIVLMHDSMTKNTTVEALPSIIKLFKSEGYSFKTLT